MSGLPGTGKDTWIAENCPGLPVISLDQIRRELGVSPSENQGFVVNEARKRARIFLRKHQPFVWNATDTTAMLRKKQLDLFHGYHASVRIVFLETGWETELLRNESRVDAVPLSVIQNLVSLRELDVSNTALLSLPYSIGNLKARKKLNFSPRVLRRFPKSILDLTRLEGYEEFVAHF